MRVDGCTLPTEDRDFERAADGRWYERTIEDADGFSAIPPCKEGGEIPPPELAWTWQDRRWR